MRPAPLLEHPPHASMQESTETAPWQPPFVPFPHGFPFLQCLHSHLSLSNTSLLPSQPPTPHPIPSRSLSLHSSDNPLAPACPRRQLDFAVDAGMVEIVHALFPLHPFEDESKVRGRPLGAETHQRPTRDPKSTCCIFAGQRLAAIFEAAASRAAACTRRRLARPPRSVRSAPRKRCPPATFPSLSLPPLKPPRPPARCYITEAAPSHGSPPPQRRRHKQRRRTRARPRLQRCARARGEGGGEGKSREEGSE